MEIVQTALDIAERSALTGNRSGRTGKHGIPGRESGPDPVNLQEIVLRGVRSADIAKWPQCRDAVNTSDDGHFLTWRRAAIDLGTERRNDRFCVGMNRDDPTQEEIKFPQLKRDIDSGVE